MEIKVIDAAGERLVLQRADASATGKESKPFSEVLEAKTGVQTTAPPAKEQTIEYIVKKGDTLWKIGRQLFQKDPYQIAKDNGLSNPNLIRPGQKLLIRPSAPAPAPPKMTGQVTASWYGPEYHQKITASGERFDMNKDTLAHKTLPFGTKVRLVNPENGKSAEGVVNDRGPYIRGRDVDVSLALAKRLGFVRKGVTKLDMETKS